MDICVQVSDLAVADLEIFEGGFTVCNNLSHAHFEALRRLVSRPATPNFSYARSK